jgi:hypothetical protein
MASPSQKPSRAQPAHGLLLSCPALAGWCPALPCPGGGGWWPASVTLPADPAGGGQSPLRSPPSVRRDGLAWHGRTRGAPRGVAWRGVARETGRGDRDRDRRTVAMRPSTTTGGALPRPPLAATGHSPASLPAAKPEERASYGLARPSMQNVRETSRIALDRPTDRPAGRPRGDPHDEPAGRPRRPVVRPRLAASGWLLLVASRCPTFTLPCYY